MPSRSEIRDFARQQTLLDIDDINNNKVNNIINEGVREVARRFNWPFLAAETTMSFLADERKNTLPEEILKIEAIIIDDGKRLGELAPSSAWEKYGDEFKGGTPKDFFLWGDDLYLVPFPDSATTLEIKYYEAPALLTNDIDEPQWASRFHMVLGDFTVWKLWEREEESRKAAAASQVFDRGVEQMARFYLNRASDTPMVFGEPGARRRVHYRSFIEGIDG